MVAAIPAEAVAWRSGVGVTVGSGVGVGREGSWDWPGLEMVGSGALVGAPPPHAESRAMVTSRTMAAGSRFIKGSIAEDESWIAQRVLCPDTPGVRGRKRKS